MLPEESEDLLQDVFLQALSNINALEAVDNLSAWLYTVTKNKIIDWYRKRRLPTHSIHQQDENGNDLQDILADESFSDWDDSTRQLVYDSIIDNVDKLPEKQKQVFIRQVIDGMTFREIAEETGESIDTLIARNRLKEINELLKDSQRCTMGKFEHSNGPKKILAIISMTIGGVLIAAVIALFFGLIVLWL